MTYTIDQVQGALRPSIKLCETEAHMNEGTKYEAVYAERAAVLRWLFDNYAGMAEDAARYRWLRDDCDVYQQKKMFGRWTGGEPNILSGHALNAAIDEGRKP
jgi:hypothetical protein